MELPEPTQRGLELRTQIVTGLLLAGVTIIAVGAVAALASQRLGVDFGLTYLPGADAVVHGKSPYPRYTYPPQVAFAYVPFTFISESLGAVLAVLVAAGLLIATLATLGVRDLRCYLAVFIWAPTWQELDMANVTSALALGVALSWRYRQSPWRSGGALGVVVPAKLFLWPVLCWTLGMRRFRACSYALLVGLIATVGTWSVLRFKGLTAYPHLLHHLDDFYGRRGYSFIGIATAHGLGRVVGELVGIVVGGALLAGCIVLARRDDDYRAFTLAIAAALALTPVLRLHYLVLLVVPVAIARPRFSVLWLLPTVLWISPTPLHPGGWDRIMPALVGTVLIGTLVHRSYEKPSAQAQLTANSA